ncbi:hypothetical protein [Kutzneria sp. NPDC052558]|uniref:hypothetical protein n=1 Tax=Kutzneria sp. NPDC052558 TaxID=3364121 RepID=UPI0037C53656
MPDVTQRPKPFADYLSSLFESVRPPDRDTPYSSKEVVERIEEIGGSISNAYLSQMRRGLRDNPTLTQIEYLGAVFGKHPAFFFGGRQDRGDLDPDRSQISARLNFLFAEIPAPGRRGERTYDDVLGAIRSRADELGDPAWRISTETLTELRRDPNPNPTWKCLHALAGAFHVKPAYFVDAELASRIQEQILTAKQLRRLGIARLAARAPDSGAPLSDQARESLVRELVKALPSLGISKQELRDALDEPDHPPDANDPPSTTG